MAATEQLEDLMGEDSDGVLEGPVVPRMVDGLKRADTALVTFVQDRPLAALGAALAVGYVVGRVFTSRS